MATTLTPPPRTGAPERELQLTQRCGSRRSAWRQRLVEAERGVTLGLRGDSTLFVHLFSGCVILASAFVLGLSVVDWAVLILALAIVVAAELFNKVIVELSQSIPDAEDCARHAIQRIATAAVFVTIAGSLSAVALLFAKRLWMLFQA